MSVRKQYFAADGRQITEEEATDRGVIRDGVRMMAQVHLMDGVPQIFNATDAERIFSDSVKGKRAVALARRAHDLGERHKRDPLPFTDAHAAAVVRAGLGLVDTMEQLQDRRNAALQDRKDAMRGAWNR